MTATAEYPTYTQTKQHDSGVNIDTNVIVADTTRMSVDSDGAAHIMSLLTDLYSDPEATVIREYISNALDSHAAAGTLAPIEVFLPSAISQNFVVHDSGTGMSADDIRQIYASYGRSTKRTDMTQVGAYGLGCKSALTMVQSFTIAAIKDGEKTVAIISRGEDGVGEIKIISISQTDLGNGVKVTIPVKNPHSFNAKAESFFFTMRPESILIDGRPPKRNLYSDDYIKLDAENSYISRKWEYTYSYSNDASNKGWYVVMGGVAYKIKPSDIEEFCGRDIRSAALWTCLKNNTSFSIYSIIPIASVDLTPSREDLRYSERTKKFLTSLLSMLSQSFIKYIQSDIEDAPSRVEAIMRYRSYTAVLKRSYISTPIDAFTTIQWRGESFTAAKFAASHVSIQYSLSGTTRVLKDTIIDIINLAGSGSKIYYLEASDDVKTSEYENFLERMKRNFSQFIRRNETDGDKDENDHLYIFNKGETPTSTWFTDCSVFTPITEKEILDGAAKWRRDRRAANATNSNSTNRVSGYTYVTLVKKSDGTESLEYGVVSPKDFKTSDLLVDAENHPDMIEIFDRKNGQGSISVVMTNLIAKLSYLKLHGVKLIYLPTTRKRDTLVSRAGFDLDSFDEYALAKTLDVWYTLSQDARDVLVSTHLHDGIASMRDISTIFSKINNTLTTRGGSLEDLGDELIVRIFRAIKEANDHITKMHGTKLDAIPAKALPEEEKKNKGWFTSIATKYPLLPISGAYYDSRSLDKSVEHFIIYIKAVNNEGKDD